MHNSKIEAFQSLVSNSPRSYNMHSTQPHTRVKKLKLASFEENIFFYIMNKSPNLQTLHLYFYPDLDMSPIDENSTKDNYYKENGDAIRQYLSKLQYYKVCNQNGFFVIKKYLKHTPNAHIDLLITPYQIPQLTLTKNILNHKLSTGSSEWEEKFKQVLKEHYQHINAFSLHFPDNYEDTAAWNEYIHATCTEMKHFKYIIYDYDYYLSSLSKITKRRVVETEKNRV